MKANGLFSGTPAMVENGPSKTAHYGALLDAHETITATKLRPSGVAVQPPKSQSSNDRETTTFLSGRHREAKIALMTTAKLQKLRANSREMTTFAESCNDR